MKIKAIHLLYLRRLQASLHLVIYTITKFNVKVKTENYFFYTQVDKRDPVCNSAVAYRLFIVDLLAMPGQSLPYFSKGVVVKGFGRGSKDLGCPTANFTEDVVDNLPEELPTGVYYGFGQVDGGEVHKMVMSIGWNPFFNNTKKSMETHLLHKFDDDFYGKELRVAMLGYLRPEKNFASLDELIKAIDDDINQAKSELDRPDLAAFKTNPYFS